MRNFVCLFMIFLIRQAHESDCVRLTNMTAPPVQDPRLEMRLHCQFDMDDEQLYAVKWYKDDHEFFRYTPTGQQRMVTFPVSGVEVDSHKTRCVKNRCDLLLINLKKPQSSGAYRCEVSSEAPEFKLASGTHNVTVAALPKEPPIIENLKKTYALDDSLLATCTSGFGDPKPILRFFINKQQVLSPLVRDISPEEVHSDLEAGIELRRTKIQLRMHLDRRHNAANINSLSNLTCVSTTDGLDREVAPPLIASRTFTVIDHNHVINNEKYTFSRSGTLQLPSGLVTIVCFIAAFNYYALLQ